MRKFVSRPSEGQPRLVSGRGRGAAVKETQGNVPPASNLPPSQRPGNTDGLQAASSSDERKAADRRRRQLGAASQSFGHRE